jgi:hypothetical protein
MLDRATAQRSCLLTSRARHARRHAAPRRICPRIMRPTANPSRTLAFDSGSRLLRSIVFPRFVVAFCTGKIRVPPVITEIADSLKRLEGIQMRHEGVIRALHLYGAFRVKKNRHGKARISSSLFASKDCDMGALRAGGPLNCSEWNDGRQPSPAPRLANCEGECCGAGAVRLNHPRRDLARSIGVCPASPPTP